MDYGRFRFLQSKKDRESRRIQKPNLLREMRFRPRIASHDRDAKLRHVKTFLSEGMKVKLTVMFRGREMSHPEAGVSLLRSVAEKLKDEAKIEAPPALEGRRMSVILVPVSSPRAKRNETEPEKENPLGEEAEKIQT